MSLVSPRNGAAPLPICTRLFEPQSLEKLSRLATWLFSLSLLAERDLDPGRHDLTSHTSSSGSAAASISCFVFFSFPQYYAKSPLCGPYNICLPAERMRNVFSQAG